MESDKINPKKIPPAFHMLAMANTQTYQGSTLRGLIRERGGARDKNRDHIWKVLLLVTKVERSHNDIAMEIAVMLHLGAGLTIIFGNVQSIAHLDNSDPVLWALHQNGNAT